MNSAFIVIIAFILTSIIGLLQIPKKDVNSDSSNLSFEIEKIEDSYSEPDTSIKIEPNYVSGKSDSVMRAPIQTNIIQNAIDSSYSKITIKSSDNMIVGVIKSGSCHEYQTIEIYMDCEDDISPNTYNQTRIYGWVGDIYIHEPGKNASLFFCAVNMQFYPIKYDYAVLMLDFFDPNRDNTAFPGIFKRVKRKHDNEKSSNQNKMIITEPNGTSLEDDHYADNWSKNGSNHYTQLYFYYFPNVGYGKLPEISSIGFNYGVFGRFGSKQGYVWIDDQDDVGFYYNKNELIIEEFNFETSQWIENDSYAGIFNIIDGGKNTRYYISKASDCD